MPRSTRLAIFRQAFQLLRDAARRIAVAALVIDVIGAVANAAMIAIAGRLLGLLAGGASFGDTVPWLVGAVVGLTVSMVTSTLHNDLSALASEHVEAHALNGVFSAAAQVPFSAFDDAVFYDRLRRAHESGSEHAWAIVQGTLNMARSVLDLVAIAVVLLFVAPVLILIGALAYVPLWFVTRLNNRERYYFEWDETEQDRRRGYLEQLLSERQPAKEIRSFGLGPELVSRYAQSWIARLAHLHRIVRAAAVRSAVAHAGSSFVVAGALAMVVWLTTRGDLTIDQAGVGVLGVRQLSNGVSRTIATVGSLHASGQFLGDYRAFQTVAAEQAALDVGHEAPVEVSQIDVRNASFTYKGATRPSLLSLNLTIRADELTAIVGANGSGKTTLMMLLAGLYEPSSGTISWDDVDTSSIAPSSRQQAVAPLFQDFVQYHFSVAENLTLTTADAHRLTEALDRAGVSEFLAGLDRGIDQQLGRNFEDGTELSIGQWQRLALARALYRRAPIVLLDEPAAALDPGAEAALVRNLKERASGQCVVMVSHRFASVRQADQIVVLDEGRLIELGSHEELIKLGGAYQALYRAQADPLLGR